MIHEICHHLYRHRSSSAQHPLVRDYHSRHRGFRSSTTTSTVSLITRSVFRSNWYLLHAAPRRPLIWRNHRLISHKSCIRRHSLWHITITHLCGALFIVAGSPSSTSSTTRVSPVPTNTLFGVSWTFQLAVATKEIVCFGHVDRVVARMKTTSSTLRSAYGLHTQTFEEENFIFQLQ